LLVATTRKVKGALPKVIGLGLAALLFTGCTPVDTSATGTESSPPISEPSESADQVFASTAGYITYETYLAAPENYADSEVVLFFNAYWCSTCKVARDSFEASINDIPEDLTIVLVDFDENTEMRKKHDVIVQHTFIQIDSSGNELQRWYGSTTVAEIEAKIS
jgi:thiol-disulfide isomerase/thioredoxin